MIIDVAIASLFWLILLCNLLVAFAFGSRFERSFATMLLAASVVGFVFSPLLLAREWIDDFNRCVDILILIVIVFAALRTDRHWPLWFAGIQMLTVISDVLAWTEFGLRYRFLANLSAMWALPAMITMTWGILLDWRRDRPRASTAR